MRNISIATGFDYSIPIDKQIAMIKNAGFSHVTISCNISTAEQLFILSKKSALCPVNVLLISLSLAGGYSLVSL